MHQPYYRNLKELHFQMPWVRLHGIKDYYDMAAILDEFPDIKQTFNLVPSLIEQIEEYVSGNASDSHLELSRKPPHELKDTEKNKILKQFFSAHFPTLVQPYTRYRKLHEKVPSGITAFSDQDFLDLQVWSNLTWFDPIFKKEPFLAGLIKKEDDFTEEEKQKLLDRQIEILANIIPKYKELQQRGQIEVSVSPFYHPILPLLCDTDIAKESNPGTKLPKQRFSHPEDAETQVQTAIEFYEKRFGHKPFGMWPSEGSVSQAIIPIIAKSGIQWIAADEEVLALSSGKSPDRNDNNNVSASGDLYYPYKVSEDGYELSVIFRDHVLSDRLGFVYANWNPEDAADDFINKLMGIKAHLDRIGSRERLAPVILDGENAWEYYVNDGHDFLHQLYQKISDHPEIETTTVSEYIKGAKNLRKIKRLHPGSWINHNFNIWIGHEEDNLAWDLLSDTRKTLVEFQNSDRGEDFDREKLKTAWNEIYIAEGSDWCWWFGDEHQSPHNEQFDSLFRSNLLYVYELLGLEPPASLLKPVRHSFLSSNIIYPVEFFTPTIDGRRSSYYEWYSAGYFDCIKAGSAMHRSEHYVKGIYFGFDQRFLYFRIDPDPTLEKSAFEVLNFVIDFIRPDKVSISFNNNLNTLNAQNAQPSDKQLTAALDEFAEIKVPLDIFSKKDANQFDFRIVIEHNNEKLEIWPQAELISIKLPEATSEAIFW